MLVAAIETLRRILTLLVRRVLKARYHEQDRQTSGISKN